MESSNKTMQSTDGKRLLLKDLREEQARYAESSAEWACIEKQINDVIAENFLHYINR